MGSDAVDIMSLVKVVHRDMFLSIATDCGSCPALCPEFDTGLFNGYLIHSRARSEIQLPFCEFSPTTFT